MMLFEPFVCLGCEDVGGQNLWDGNPFHGANNVRGIDADRNRDGLGDGFLGSQDPAVVATRKAYIEKVVDTLNDLDSILWELCSEPLAGSLEWQREVLRTLKWYEARKRQQHPVLWSAGEAARRGSAERPPLVERPEDYASMQPLEVRARPWALAAVRGMGVAIW